MIHRTQDQYIKALKDLARATLVSHQEHDIDRYQRKAEIIVARLQSGDAIDGDGQTIQYRQNSRD